MFYPQRLISSFLIFLTSIITKHSQNLNKNYAYLNFQQVNNLSHINGQKLWILFIWSEEINLFQNLNMNTKKCSEIATNSLFGKKLD